MDTKTLLEEELEKHNQFMIKEIVKEIMWLRNNKLRFSAEDQQWVDQVWQQFTAPNVAQDELLQWYEQNCKKILDIRDHD